MVALWSVACTALPLLPFLQSSHLQLTRLNIFIVGYNYESLASESLPSAAKILCNCSHRDLGVTTSQARCTQLHSSGTSQCTRSSAALQEDVGLNMPNKAMDGRTQTSKPLAWSTKTKIVVHSRFHGPRVQMRQRPESAQALLKESKGCLCYVPRCNRMLRFLGWHRFSQRNDSHRSETGGAWKESHRGPNNR